jgi:hypothetical protein
MSSLQLFPEVIDGSTLGERVSSSIFLPIGIEGRIDSDGSAVAGQLKLISRESDAVAFFGAVSSLTTAIKYLLRRGSGPVWAIASKKNGAPLLADRQAAWQTLEAKREIRIRLTDSIVQADHVALATSCDNANILNNKQFAVYGMASGTTKSNLISAAQAANSKRSVLVGPAVYDDTGVLISGAYAAMSVAARVAQNNDPSDDLDTVVLPLLTGMEHDANGNDLFRQIVVGGVLQNDFEDMLQDGVSPLMPGLDGGVAISHLRMTYTDDSTFDSLMTRIIMDQLFILVRDYATRSLALRKGNNAASRAQLRSGIDALLRAQKDILTPVDLGDGTTGYGVTVTSSPDERQMIIGYQGEIVRGTQTILVAPSLTIAA